MRLFKRKGSPHWWVGIGRKTRKSARTADREKAKEFGRILEERLWRINQLGDRSAVSWKEAADRWITDSAKPKERDREFLVWLEPTIGAYPVSDVANPDVLEEIRKDGLAEGWAHSTVDRLMATVRAVLKSCVRWQYLTHAPSVPMYRPGLDEPKWLTPEEFAALCKELPKHLELAARFAVLTLLRMRAMLQLTWDRVDLKARRAWIPRQQQKAKKTFGFSLSSEAIKVLKELRELNPEGRYVFQWKEKPIDDCNGKAFQDALERAGVKGANWHSLRHTGASWAVQNGVTLQELMQLGDWKDYRSVLRYAHLAPSHSASAAEKVAQMSHTGKRANKREFRKRA